MCNNELLNVILVMKNIIKNNKEPDGKYSIEKFKESGIIEYDLESKDTLYVRDSIHGDHAIIFNEQLPSHKNLFWAERVADEDTHGPAVVSTISQEVLNYGDCVCLLKNIGMYGAPLYVPDSYVSIPRNFIGMTNYSKIEGVGYIVVVPDLLH